MQRLKFNANQFVYVRLTEHGLQVLRDAAAELRIPSITTPYREPVPDERGFSQFQLWEFMEAFGPYTAMGRRDCFEMNVEFQADDLTPVEAPPDADG